MEHPRPLHYKIGVVGRMATRPVEIPGVFTGVGSQNWSDWLDHFDSVAEVNGWDAGSKISGWEKDSWVEQLRL